MNYTPISPNSKQPNSISASLEFEKLTKMLQQAQLPQVLYEKSLEQVNRLSMMMKYGNKLSEIESIEKYFDWISSLPWQKTTQDILDIQKAQVVMDKNHYGLVPIKNRVLEYLSTIILRKKKVQGGVFHAPILFFVGLAGTGKTTFAVSIAQALGRKFARIPFGGLSSPLDLRGLSKVQPEAEPGLIIKALRRIESKNPVILLDELDRIAPESRGAIMGVLLELLDPEQNSAFADHYIDFPFDLSQAIFVATSNNTNSISTAVMDRLEVIQMPSYTDEDKIAIAKNFILPRLEAEVGLKPENVTIDEPVWKHLARLSGYDPGIRSVERKVETIIRKIAFKVVQTGGDQYTVNEANMKEYID